VSHRCGILVVTRRRGEGAVQQRIYRFGDDYVDLTDDLTDLLLVGAVVLWISASGTRQLLAQTGGLLTRTRVSSGNPHPGDTFALILESPWSATSCGLTCASGYCSTPPAWVGVVETAADVEAAYAEAVAALHGVSQDRWEALTTGHPHGPCGALHCRDLAAPI
jgi:hypothetical protein